LEREETTAGACAGRLANSAANRRNMGGEPCCFLLRHYTQPAVPTRPAVPTITSFSRPIQRRAPMRHPLLRLCAVAEWALGT
jgi:hypothetical protein